MRSPRVLHQMMRQHRCQKVYLEWGGTLISPSGIADQTGNLSGIGYQIYLAPGTTVDMKVYSGHELVRNERPTLQGIDRATYLPWRNFEGPPIKIIKGKKRMVKNLLAKWKRCR